MQEKRIDDHWNVDPNRGLSDSWKGFTKFTLLKEKRPKGNMWSWERLTKVQTTTRPDHVWLEVWSNIGKAAQSREEPEWKKREAKTRQRSTTERNLLYWPRCGRAVQEGDIHSSTRKLVAELNAPQKIPKTIYGVKWNLTNSQGNEWNLLYLKITETTFAGKGYTSMSHYNFVHKFIPMPQEMKIPDAKAAVGKEWKKLETILAWNLAKIKSKNEVILEAQSDKNNVHFATRMVICHLKNAELEPQSHTRAESCSRETL